MLGLGKKVVAAPRGIDNGLLAILVLFVWGKDVST